MPVAGQCVGLIGHPSALLQAGGAVFGAQNASARWRWPAGRCFLQASWDAGTLNRRCQYIEVAI
jgi:hypothetical protein